MLKKIICSLLLCSVMLTTACVPRNTDNAPEIAEPEFTMGQIDRFVYQNNLYYIKGGLLYYCALEDLKEIETYSKCLCFDPLCEHRNSGCMGYIGGRVIMCFRTVGDTVFMYTSYENLTNRTYEIARYDISNAEKTLLLDNIDNYIQRLIVTDDVIIFEEWMGNYTSLRTYSLSDTEYHEQPNEDEIPYYLIGYDNGLVYYNDVSGNVYSNSPTFDSEEKILTGILPYGYYVYNGELYFPHKMKSQKIPEIKNMSFNSIDVYKTPLDSPSESNYTKVASNVCCYGRISHYIFEDTFYYLPSIPSYVGEATVSYDDMPDMVFTIINEHDGTLCSVDVQRLRKSNVAEKLGYNIQELIYASPEYIIFSTSASGYRTDIDFDQFGAVFVYEPPTEELYKILYYGPNKETSRR